MSFPKGPEDLSEDHADGEAPRDSRNVEDDHPKAGVDQEELPESHDELLFHPTCVGARYVDLDGPNMREYFAKRKAEL